MSEIFYRTETAVIRRPKVLNIERPVNDFGAEDFGPPKTFRVNAAGKEIQMGNENKNNNYNINNNDG